MCTVLCHWSTGPSSLWTESLAPYFTQCNLFLPDYKAETKLFNRLVLVFGRQSLYSLCCGKTNLGSHVRLRKPRDAHVNRAACDNWLCDLSQDIIPSRICLFDLNTGDPGQDDLNGHNAIVLTPTVAPHRKMPLGVHAVLIHPDPTMCQTPPYRGCAQNNGKFRDELGFYYTLGGY